MYLLKYQRGRRTRFPSPILYIKMVNAGLETGVPFQNFYLF